MSFAIASLTMSPLLGFDAAGLHADLLDIATLLDLQLGAYIAERSSAPTIIASRP